MRVRAIQKGYYNLKIQEVGAVFELVPYKADKLVYGDDGKPVYEKGSIVQKVEKDHLFTAEEQFSDKWMEEVESDEKSSAPAKRLSKTPLKDEKAGKALPAQHGEIEQPSDKDVI